MTVNLLELVQQQLSGPITSQIGSLLGTDAKDTDAAIAAAAPSLLGGLMKKGSTDTGLGALAGTLDGFDGGLLDNLGSMFSKEGSGGLSAMGGNLLGSLFGGSLGNITDILGRVTSLGSGKLGSLLKMLAPVVFGVLAKQKGLLGLGAAGLGKLLMEQAKFLKGKMPAGIGSSLGINSLLDGRPTQAAVNNAPHPSVREAPANSKGSLLSKLVPLAIVAALGMLAYRHFSSPTPTQASEGHAAVVEAKDEVVKTFGGITTAFGSITDTATAEAKAPELIQSVKNLTEIRTTVDGLPREEQGAIRKMAETFLPNIEAKIGEVMGLSAGVKSVLEPIAKNLLNGVRAIAG